MSLNKDHYFREYLTGDGYYPGKPSYNPYNPYDEGRFRSWQSFQQKRPKLARLLVILFGSSASEVHLEVNPISEEKAGLLVSFFETYPVGLQRVDILEPVGDC